MHMLEPFRSAECCSGADSPVDVLAEYQPVPHRNIGECLGVFPFPFERRMSYGCIWEVDEAQEFIQGKDHPGTEALAGKQGQFMEFVGVLIVFKRHQLIAARSCKLKEEASHRPCQAPCALFGGSLCGNAEHHSKERRFRLVPCRGYKLRGIRKEGAIPAIAYGLPDASLPRISHPLKEHLEAGRFVAARL